MPLMAIMTIAIFIWSSGVYNYINIDSLREHEAFLQKYVAEYYIFSICIFCLLYFLIVALSIPVATIMTLIAGFFFDQLTATICVVIPASFGACIIFFSAKMASENFIKNDVSKWVKKMQKGFEANSFSYMLTLRLMPIVPFVVINLVAGLLQIPFKNFFFGTLIGIIPATLMYVSVGISMRELLNAPNFSFDNLFGFQILLYLSGIAILGLLPIIFKKLKRR